MTNPTNEPERGDVVERAAVVGGDFDPRNHAMECDYHCDQNPQECTCGRIKSIKRGDHLTDRPAP